MSELILRNREALPRGSILLINPPRDTLFRELGTRAAVQAFTQDYGDYEWLATAGANVAFDVLPWREPDVEIPGQARDDAKQVPHVIPPPDSHVISAPEPGSPTTAIFFLPREKARLDFLLHAIACHLPPEGILWLVGENRAGVKSAGKRLQARFRKVEKLDNARHSGLFRATCPEPSDTFRLKDYREQWELELPAGLAGGALRVASLPGVFAHGRLDGGTAVLLSFLGENFTRLRIHGSVLDFGCGAGVLGLALLRANPELRVTLLDSSALALASARWTIEANLFPSAKVELAAADGLASEGPRYDWIVSNPPFHRGVDTDLDIARGFFRTAAERLSRSGRLLVVCNRHLPYEGWLDEHFPIVENPLADREFKILLAARK